MTRHLLDITDFTSDELATMLQLAQRPGLPNVLEGQGVALIFEKPSNRTRHSMEMAVVHLGGHPVYTRGEEIGLDVRESVEDVTRVMAGYHALIAARVFQHDKVVRMAACSPVTVVNMLSDWSHPLQALADMLTMQQVHGSLDDRTVAFVGDWNNVSRSLAEICVILGVNVSLGCPVGYDCTEAELERLNSLGAGQVRQTARALDAVEGAIAVHTDTWTSMGQENDGLDRVGPFRPYQLNTELLALADSEAIVLHCLPAHRGEEITDEVIDGQHSAVWDEAENRLHAQKALLVWLLERAAR